MHSDLLLVRLSKLMPLARPASPAQPQTDDAPSLYEQVHNDALAGDLDACVRLGRIHEDGLLGKRPEPAVAYRHYLQAAVEEHAEAQYRLGLMARDGSVEQPDAASAWMWLALAARNGKSEASTVRDAVLRRLSAREHRMAEALVDHWPRIKASNGRLIHFYRGLLQ